MKVIVSAGGRFHAISLATILARHRVLEHFFSCSTTNKERDDIGQHRVTHIWPCTIADTMFQRLRLNRIIDKTWYNFNKDSYFDSCVAQKLKNLSFDLLVVWANYGLQSIKQAHKKGVRVLIESGSAHIREQEHLLREEYEKLKVPGNPIYHATAKRMTQEYALADYIVVPSSFVINSFVAHGVPANKLLRIPCSMNLEPLVVERPLNNSFRAIFVGLLSVRKGIHYLIDAWNDLDIPESTSQLILVGSLQADLAHVLRRKKMKGNIFFYGPASQETVRQLYAQSTVFVLPSVEDGFGMVMGEAMASGLPVICTTNTAAHDLIDDNVTGFVLPVGDSQALATKLRWCHDFPDKAFIMGKRAQDAIRKQIASDYDSRILAIYNNILNRKRPQ